MYYLSTNVYSGYFFEILFFGIPFAFSISLHSLSLFFSIRFKHYLSIRWFALGIVNADLDDVTDRKS